MFKQEAFQPQINKTVIINATATKFGGALTILKEYLSEIKKFDSKSIYFIFCGMDLSEFISDNIKVVPIKTHGFGLGGLKRIFWDALGLYGFCLIKRIKPNLIISFQNTGVIYPNVKQLIYYHQPVPLFKFKWKFYKKDETLLFIYKEIYPFLIRLMFNRNSEFVVQQKFLKKLFSDKFNIKDERIHVIVPNINVKFKSSIEKIVLDQSKFNIFYPTNAAKYKNYDILFSAISKIKEASVEVYDKLILHITLGQDTNGLKDKIDKYQISTKIHFLGIIPYESVIAYYNSVQLLVFPSYIETFGLPLIEAASLGLPILVSDLDYSHEVLKKYEGATFIQFDDDEKWANAIIETFKTKPKVYEYESDPENNSWNKFIALSNFVIHK